MKHFLTFIMSCYIMAMNAQSTFEYLDVNNIRAGFSAYGHLFYDVDSQKTAKFTINNSPLNSAFTINEASLWIAGIDHLGGFSVSGEQCFVYDPIFQPGPVGNNYVTVIQPTVFDSTYDNTYRKIWKISKTEIDNHTSNYGNVGYNMPWAIANWPGNGNTLNGESARLAPFNDINGNNIYEPVYGEHPMICGDEAVYFIYNDHRSHSNISGLLPLFFEIHGMAFAFKDSVNEDLFNTVFVTYKLFNKSNYDYNTIVAGLYTDLDFKNTGNYVGCDTSLNAFFSYAAKPDTSSNASFGLFTPSQGVVFLDRQQSNFSCFRNDFTVSGNPSSYNHIYNYLTSRYKDGTNFKIDCDPYNGGSVNTNYAFFDDPNDSMGFSQIACNSPLVDIRALGTVNAGSVGVPIDGNFSFTVAFVYQNDTLSAVSNLTSITKLKQRIQNIQNYYNQGLIGCPAMAVGVDEKINSKNVSLKIYPNPASQMINIQTDNVQSSIKRVMMFDVTGKAMFGSTSLTMTHATVDVSNLPNGLYFLHVEMSNGERLVRKVMKE